MINKQKWGNIRGFTLIELMVVIAVLAILAGITVIGYGKWRESVAQKEVQSDLQMVAAAMESAKNFGSDYPSSIPSNYKPSSGVITEMTSQSTGKYCINGYSKVNKSVRMSVSSDDSKIVRDYLCVGQTNGSVVGGVVPATPTGVSVAPGFGSWTLTGSTAYNPSTRELTLGTSGTATSPKIKVNGVAGINVNGQFFATAISAAPSIMPSGGWHSGSLYYTADGTTAATNSAGYTGNGCAGKVNLNSWSSAPVNCGYALAGNVVYVRIILYSSGSSYASSDLKAKDVTFTLY